MKKQGTIKFQIDNDIATITFDAPPLNILTDQFLEELNQVIDQLSLNNVRVAVLKSSSPKAFIAGADISQFPDMDRETGYQLVNKGKNVFDRLEQLPFPVIAAINGAALGGGLELALACDIRIIEREAKIGLPEVTLGVFPGYGGTQRLTRLVGPGKTKELIYTGLKLDGEEAYRLGIAEQITEEQEAYERALEMAHAITKNAPLAIAGAKKSIDQSFGKSLEEGEEIESDQFAAICESEDVREGVNAFTEKRQPDFKGE